MEEIILASASPRRAFLLTQLGIPFQVHPTAVDERPPKGATIESAVRQIALRKLHAALPRAPPQRVVVAADTVVVYGEQIIGKPRDEADAVRILTMLAEHQHHVLTALAVAGADRHIHEAVEWTAVRFGPLSTEQVRAYVATGEPLDKAGAYAIQGQGSAFIESIGGDYSNVVGLPMRALLRLLGLAGYPLPAHLRVS